MRRQEGAQAPRTPERNEGFYKAIVEKTAEVVKVCLPDGTLTYANPAFHNFYGWEVEEVIDSNILEYVHPNDIDLIARETEAALEGSADSPGPVSNRAVYRFRCADGTYRVMEALGTYLMDDEDIGGVIIFSRETAGPRK